MKRAIQALAVTVMTGAWISLAQAPGQAPGSPPGRGAGRGGAPAGPPAVPSISLRRSGAALGNIRFAAQDNTLWFGWNVSIPTASFKQLTFSEALAKADVLILGSVEASSAQKVSFEVPKNLDYRLQKGERAAVNYRMQELSQQIGPYRVDNVGADEDTRRKVFEFAKAINVKVIIVSEQSPLAELDKLAEEFGLNVALDSRKDPKTTMSALEGRSKRMGVAADLGGWMQAGIKPEDGLNIVKSRLMYVKAVDRSALGARGNDVILGSGVGALPDFFLALFRTGLTPLYITVDSTGAADAYADILKNLNGFERVMWPAMAARVRQMLDTPAGKIRGGDRLPPEMRAQIDAAAPRSPIVQPKKPRKLLVTDIQMYSGHGTIPHGNLMLELMGKYSGAFEPVFSNDPDLLKYPKIKEFDAIFLNNVCGMVHNDPEVREGILRFIREGGGIGGNHAVTYANNNWPEFAEMMGGWSGQHHTETQIVKIDDPNSPLMKMFGSEPFEHTDEFYHFPDYSPFSREKQHVLMSIDVQKSDGATSGRFCPLCTRPDQDYGVAWVKAYGKGRTYFTPLGHTTIMYTDKRWTQHMLAAVQYMLGDLDVDATPSAKLAAKKK